jgi:Zn-dependent protease with chaperone function
VRPPAYDARPSLRLRALLAIVLLAGFYAVTLLVALALLAVAGLFAWGVVSRDSVNLQALIFAVIFVIPALLLIYGVFTARPPRFEPPGLSLDRGDAPALFAMLDELSAAAKTASPSRVYLTALPDLAVTQIGGFFGLGSTRVLIVGAPLLHLLTVGQLRAGLAHEYGHFVGADTALSGIESYTRALFRSVLLATRREPFAARTHFAIAAGKQLAEAIGAFIARRYASLYFRVTSALARRQEVAADVLAAEIAGTSATVATLERVSLGGRHYRLYLDVSVGEALDAGAMPSDLLEGFDAFRAGFGKTDFAKELERAVRSEATDPYDTHPALQERVAIVSDLARKVAEKSEDGAAATSLLELDVAAWLCEATLALYERPVTLEGVARLEKMPWREVPERGFEARARKRAEGIRRRLAPAFPDAQTSGALLASAVRALESGAILPLAERLQPGLGSAYGPRELGRVSQEVCARALVGLFEAALLEGGARATASLGAPCVIWRYADEDVPATKIAALAFEHGAGRAAMMRWAERLEAR